MKKDYISIIIPCYNVEKYIEKCIESIQNQTYNKNEIILVDDCSTDNTYNIIKELEKNNKNITVIKNKENMGAGKSRNEALKQAKYDLISFIDSDDFIENNFHEELLKSLKENKSDIAVCDIYMKYDEGFDEQDFRSYACDGEVNKYNFINNGLASSPCNKLFRKELLLNNLFAEGIMNEDIPTVIGCMLDAEKISYTKETYYNYFQRKTSVQNASISFKRFDLFKAIDLLLERKKDIDQEYLQSIIYNQIIVFLIYVIPKEKSFSYRYKLLKEYHKLSKKYNIKQNKLFWNFLSSQPKMSKLYYKVIFKFNCAGLCLFANLVIQFYSIYRKLVYVNVIDKNITMNSLIKAAKKQSKMKEKINVSVVIPNYNYEKFMYERLYSILNQNIKLNEIIILDDCSSDNSRELIDEIVNNLQNIINIKKVYNETNSGSAFRQWRKGFELATSDYVWIAEADDYCQKNFLKNISKPMIKDKLINLSYCDTAFINKEGNIIIKSTESSIDIMKTNHWHKNFVNKGMNEVENYAFLNCTVANVSSVLFKRQDYSKYFDMSGEYRQAGDWLFYVNVMKDGKIAYCSKALNYYRVHGSNVTSTTKKQAHYDEIKRIHKYISTLIKFDDKHNEEIEKRYDFLKKVWDLK